MVKRCPKAEWSTIQAMTSITDKKYVIQMVRLIKRFGWPLKMFELKADIKHPTRIRHMQK